MSATSPSSPASSRSQSFSGVNAATTLLVASALATLLMLQAMRVLVSYLVVVVGQANRSALERDIFVVTLAIALAPLVIRFGGLRATAALSAMTAAVARVVLQFWSLPEARLLMAAAIVVLWGWMTIALLDMDRRALSYGLLAGLVLDVVVRGAFLTLDLPWNSSVTAAMVATIVAGLLLAASLSVWATVNVKRSAHQSSTSLIAIGTGLGVFHLIGGNLGLAQTKTGLEFAPALSILSIGLALGLFGSVLLEREMGRRPVSIIMLQRVALIGIGAGAIWIFWTNESVAPLVLPVIVAINLMLIASSIWSNPQPAKRSIAPSIWFSLGMLLQVGILFYYYDTSGRPLYLVIAAAFLGIGSLSGAARAHQASWTASPLSQATGLLLAPLTVLVFVCAWQLVGAAAPTSGEALPGTFTVMTYNLQNGFAADNSFDLEAQADTIEASHPDVVVLQEVSRGWLVTSGADEALWLSHRLDMPVYFGGNSYDGLWGNAILTRAPIDHLQQIHFSVTKNLERGAIEASVQTAAGDFWVIGTHLDNPKAADDIRLEQTRQLIENLNGRMPAVIMGDFNADPGTAVLEDFGKAGFDDPGTTFLANSYTTTDQRRIDYVLVSTGLNVRAMQALDSPASDHKPVIAELILNPR